MENLNYKMGWLVVMFDLPVTTKEARHAYTKFHDFLLEDGYIMIQFSVYARACVTYARQETHLRRLKQYTPPDGSIRAFILTNAQWEKMMIFYGSPSKQINPEELPEQLLFW